MILNEHWGMLQLVTTGLIDMDDGMYITMLRNWLSNCIHAGFSFKLVLPDPGLTNTAQQRECTEVDRALHATGMATAATGQDEFKMNTR